MNAEKVAVNVCHAVLIAAMSFLAAHPDTAPWLVPALAWCGQCLQPPNLTPGVPHVPPTV